MGDVVGGLGGSFWLGVAAASGASPVSISVVTFSSLVVSSGFLSAMVVVSFLGVFSMGFVDVLDSSSYFSNVFFKNTISATFRIVLFLSVSGYYISVLWGAVKGSGVGVRCLCRWFCI